MHAYLIPLTEIFQQHADPETAEPMKQYMRNKFEFLGIKSPQRRALQKTFIAEHGLPPMDDLDEIIRQLWDLPEREYQYAAIDLIDRRHKKLTPEHVPLLEYLILTKSWWDTVDSISDRQIGKLFMRYPDIRDDYIGRWRKSDNIWLRRTTLLFQFPYKKDTDESLLFELIRENLDSKEFFIQKAIGWALREYSKSNAESVITFVARTELPPLSHREALKWLKNKGVIDSTPR
ncbi:MAG: DNA alkylation repair protein [Candidatus Promineifilaceae bacterium]